MSVSLSISPVTEHDTVKLAKKILGENEVASVLRRLGRLTWEESRATATQTFDVVHGLVQNMRVVMDGEPTRSDLAHVLCDRRYL